MYTFIPAGTRVVDKKSTKTIGTYTFRCWGQSTNEYTQPYLTFACSIGMTKDDVNGFAARLDKCFGKFLLNKRKNSSSTQRPSTQWYLLRKKLFFGESTFFTHCMCIFLWRTSIAKFDLTYDWMYKSKYLWKIFFVKYHVWTLDIQSRKYMYTHTNIHTY